MKEITGKLLKIIRNTTYSKAISIISIASKIASFIITPTFNLLFLPSTDIEFVI